MRLVEDSISTSKEDLSSSGFVASARKTSRNFNLLVLFPWSMAKKVLLVLAINTPTASAGIGSGDSVTGKVVSETSKGNGWFTVDAWNCCALFTTCSNGSAKIAFKSSVFSAWFFLPEAKEVRK